MSILSIGIDSIEIARFKSWHKYSSQKLNKIFTAEEITYCLQEQIKSAERFAARFATKEAFFKAFSAVFNHKYPFYTVARCITIMKETSGSPLLKVDWERLIRRQNPPLMVHISLTHTKTVATAFVIIEKMAESE